MARRNSISSVLSILFLMGVVIAMLLYAGKLKKPTSQFPPPVNIEKVEIGKADTPPIVTVKPKQAPPPPSESKLADFWSKARLKITLPDSLAYHMIDVDAENLLVLNGANEKNGTGLLLIARKSETSASEIMPFLLEAGLLKPEGAVTPRSLPSADKVVPLPRVSKLQTLEVWGLQGKIQARVIGLVNRPDRLGSYVFVYTTYDGTLNDAKNFIIEMVKKAEAI